jgi:hypothetical protein
MVVPMYGLWQNVKAKGWRLLRVLLLRLRPLSADSTESTHGVP